ncbi:MAG: hypothetical protein J5903_00030, partial [Clostridia bacterium]|nr:hypothetical protein [Clostridia bacterium]
SSWRFQTGSATLTFNTPANINRISQNGNYLNLTGTTTVGAGGSGTTENRATFWSTPSAGQSGTISTTYNKAVYYLKASGTTLSAGTSGATTWTRSADGQLSYTSGTTTYYLTYESGWKLITIDGLTNYSAVSGLLTISSEGYYLNQASATAIGASTNGNAATVWQYDQSASRFIARYNGNAYYLNKNNTNSAPTAMAVNTTANATWTKLSNGFYTTYNNVNYSAYYDGGWKLGNNSVSFSAIAANFRASANDKITRRTSETLNAYEGESYFPIITEGGSEEYENAQDGVAASDKYLVAHEKNTGYIISGGMSDSATVRNGFGYGQSAGGSAGNIRVSQYAISNLDTSKKNNVYYALTTTNDNGTEKYSAIDYSGNITANNYTYTGATLAELNFVNFVSARRNLNKLLEGATNVYGLHFMDALIDVGNYMTADRVLINGDYYTNYQLPRNSIDFNLKEQGYITFFAGSYFSGNTAFFSLHHIYRNSDNTLRYIYEIQYVYVVTVEIDDKDVKFFFYEYKDKAGEEKYSFHYDRHGNYNANKYYNHNAIDSTTGNYVEFTAEDAIYEYITSASGNKRSSWVKSFDTDWITAPARMITNALYYFELPANQGEYALGSVSGSTGAYLIYLDIAAYGETESENSQEVRTSISLYDMPKGIQVVNSVAALPENVTLDEQKSTGAVLTSGYSGELTIKYVGENYDEHDEPTGTCKFDYETTSAANGGNTEQSDEVGYYEKAAGIKGVYPPDTDAITVKTGGNSYKLVVGKGEKVNVARLIVSDDINATNGNTTRTVTLQDFGLFDKSEVYELDANGDIVLDEHGNQVKKESFDKVTIPQMLTDESYKVVISFTYSFTDAESSTLSVTFKATYVPYDKFKIELTTNSQRTITVA